MVTKSKLKMALAAESGVDFKKLSLKKKEKIARKRKSLKEKDVKPSTGNKRSSDDEGGEEEGNGEGKEAVDCTESQENSSKLKADAESVGIVDNDNHSSDEDGSEDNDEEDEDIPFSDLEDLDDEDNEDLIPHQRLTINNTVALAAALKRISLPISELPFSEHQSVTTSKPISIPDISDDLNRELAFYAQSLAAAKEGRKKLKAEGVPFTRPNDYFAEMVKPDEHMEQIKSKLIDEAASKKASAEARKQRDLKKFGKQVQVAKQQERDRERKSALEKIKILKRKRQGTTVQNENEADIFDVAVDEEIKSSFRDKRDGLSKRKKKDEKFGFGGRKKFKKSGDAISSGDLRGFSIRKMKAGVTKNRPGKARRASKR